MRNRFTPREWAASCIVRLRNAIEDYKTNNTLYNKASGLYYTMLERDGKCYQRRHEMGFDGQETNVVEEQIDYVIGSGNDA